MEKALERIRSGEFAESWTGNPRAYETLKELMNKISEHPIEKVGEKIRKMANI
jgi:ketol-acid reductoisomerase